MKEANHLAAVEIFEKVNASLLPQNVLDLHGLHVDEAIEHLTTVLQKKTEGRSMLMTLVLMTLPNADSACLPVQTEAVCLICRPSCESFFKGFSWV